MPERASWWKTLSAWPVSLRGLDRRVLSSLLPPGVAAALVLDRRFARPLRQLGYTLVGPDADPATPTELRLVCATVRREDALLAVRQHRDRLPAGGRVIVYGSSRTGERERLSAAFLHAGLLDIRQVRVGRGFLTAGTVPTGAPESRAGLQA